MDQKGESILVYMCLTLTLNKKCTPKHNYFLGQHALQALLHWLYLGHQFWSNTHKIHVFQHVQSVDKSKNEKLNSHSKKLHTYCTKRQNQSNWTRSSVWWWTWDPMPDGYIRPFLDLPQNTNWEVCTRQTSDACDVWESYKVIKCCSPSVVLKVGLKWLRELVCVHMDLPASMTWLRQ